METTPEKRPPNQGIQVKLLGHSPDPLTSLYMAYRVAYSALTPIQIQRRIQDDRITRPQMLEFVMKRLETGHASPLEQVWFEFGISGVSRAFSHQFVRHHIGISFEQQSQRYVTFKDGEFPYTTPESVKKAGMEADYHAEFDRLADLYDRMIQAGVPAEDARFVLPNASNTNFKVNVNFLELLHIADLRLCTRAQWEFRKVVALMRKEVILAAPELGQYLQPKCGQFRTGYCDEAFEHWLACPLGGRGGKRPHKSVLFRIYETVTRNLEEYVPQYKTTRGRNPVQADQIALFDTTDLAEPHPEGQASRLDDGIISMASLSETDFDIIESEESST